MRTTIQQSENPGSQYFKKPVYDRALVSNETTYALPINPMNRGSKDFGIIEFDQENRWESLYGWDKVIRPRQTSDLFGFGWILSQRIWIDGMVW